MELHVSQEVKERFQKKLYKYLAGEVEDEVSVTTL